MSLTLYYHPLSSFCHKALIALYENATPFTPQIVDLGDAAVRRGVQGDLADRQVSGAARRGEGPAGPGIQHHHRVSRPALSGRARASCPTIRSWRGRRASATGSTICYLHVPMQKIVTDRLRPAGKNDPHGVEDARKTLHTALGMVDRAMADNDLGDGRHRSRWRTAPPAPPLFYANMMSPLAGTHPNVDRYLKRLMERPSYARALEEARPYLHLFPKA